MIQQERLAALRANMINEGIDAYIIASADPHISEYLPEYYKSFEWISGFTGSAGTLVITADFAGLWTDSRYFVQATSQLKDTGFQLVPLKTQGAVEYAQWLNDALAMGSTVAFDGKLISIAVAQQIISKLEPGGIIVKGDVDLIDNIWDNRPGLPTEKAFLLSEEQTGQSTAEKIEKIRAVLKEQRAQFHLVSSLDDIAWIFNIRGADVKCNPVVLSFALISEENIELFIDSNKLNVNDRQALESNGITLRAYENIEYSIEMIPADAAVLIDPKRNCYSYYNLIPASCKKILTLNPSTSLKAIKNQVELENTRATMIKDGVALTRFFHWLEENIATQKITEMTVAEKLYEFRGEQEGFIGESFDTIAGYREHGALPHYKATPETNSVLEPDGLLLIDSGGQYTSGTTDITRVISLGNPVESEKIDYTLVLKAMIEGSSIHFPERTRGYQIDAITRKPLWEHFRDYGHGTGHGVGFFLNVHEGPQVFNSSNVDVTIEENMITSIEPGLYRINEYGIRIENLVVSCKDTLNDFGSFMSFETMSLCYIETSLILKNLLEAKHIEWLNNYHYNVFSKLAPYLNEEDRQWLKNKTLAI